MNTNNGTPIGGKGSTSSGNKNKNRRNPTSASMETDSEAEKFSSPINHQNSHVYDALNKVAENSSFIIFF